MHYLVLVIIVPWVICWASPTDTIVDYTGHKVITVVPANEDQLEYIKQLRDIHELDLWNEPYRVNIPVMIRLRPEIVAEAEQKLKEAKMSFVTAIFDLQSAIEAEKIANAPLGDVKRASLVDFNTYLRLSEITRFLQEIGLSHFGIAEIIEIGRSYENKPIMAAKIGLDQTKPAIIIECGIHAREWVSVSSCIFAINELTSKYASDSEVKDLVSNHQWYIVPTANPDGYYYTWQTNRIWRKTRSRSRQMVPPYCIGADANRNFNTSFCGVGSNKYPCADDFCGDEPFSESESRALRDLVRGLGNRLLAYFAVHSYSQLWMSPYGYTKRTPPNYDELMRICKVGTDALRAVNGTDFKCGSIANTIYPATGSSIDWAYENAGVKYAFALELRDKGRYGFMLPNSMILPACQETWAGLKAAVNAM